HQHVVRQRGIVQPIVPERGLPDRLAGFGQERRARQTITLRELIERQHACPVLDQPGGEIGIRGQRRREDIAELARLLKIVGLQIAERALVKIARVGGLQHLEAEEVGALGGVAWNDENGQRSRQFTPRRIEHARAHARRGTPPILAWRIAGCGTARRGSRRARAGRNAFSRDVDQGGGTTSGLLGSRPIGSKEILPTGKLISSWLTAFITKSYSRMKAESTNDDALGDTAKTREGKRWPSLAIVEPTSEVERWLRQKRKSRFICATGSIKC